MAVIDFTKTGILGPDDFAHFGCKVFRENPGTPDWLTRSPDTREPAREFYREVFTDGRMTMWDGQRVRHWGFVASPLATNTSRPFPSPTLRFRVGDLIHNRLVAHKSSHTIHHHGLEPTTMNDGVGHVSFEVTDSYIYQFVPRSPGTWFYHCHKNTVLHFEMGLYGLMIVDPRPQSDERTGGYLRRGFKRAFTYSRSGSSAGSFDPQYEIEALWVADDIDPAWRNIDHEGGLCGEDVGLNVFNPKYFLLTGIASNPNKNYVIAAADAKPPVTQAPITTFTGPITARRGQRILIRMLNASYSMLRTTFTGLNPKVISVDGHPLGTADRPWSRPYNLLSGNVNYSVPNATSSFDIGTAKRHDLYIDTTNVPSGIYRVRMDFQHWITRQPHANGRVDTTITVI